MLFYFLVFNLIIEAFDSFSKAFNKELTSNRHNNIIYILFLYYFVVTETLF